MPRVVSSDVPVERREQTRSKSADAAARSGRRNAARAFQTPARDGERQPDVDTRMSAPPYARARVSGVPRPRMDAFAGQSGSRRTKADEVGEGGPREGLPDAARAGDSARAQTQIAVPVLDARAGFKKLEMSKEDLANPKARRRWRRNFLKAKYRAKQLHRAGQTPSADIGDPASYITDDQQRAALVRRLCRKAKIAKVGPDSTEAIALINAWVMETGRFAPSVQVDNFYAELWRR